MEVERKWRVAAAPSLDGWEATPIDQGYLAVTGEVEVRVRRKGGRCFLTVKSAPALSRVEEELPLEEEAFARLWPLTEGRRIVKVRHTQRGEGGVVLELDVFGDRLSGLVLLEVEFPSEEAAAAWAAPSWAGEEVTGDPRFANQSLAARGVEDL